MRALKSLIISGREVLPLVEGGKGISISNGESSGAWASAGGVGTFSGVNADSYDPDGRKIEQIYYGKTRRERHEELLTYAIGRGVESTDNCNLKEIVQRVSREDNRFSALVTEIVLSDPFRKRRGDGGQK